MPLRRGSARPLTERTAPARAIKERMTSWPAASTVHGTGITIRGGSKWDVHEAWLLPAQ
jgi:hypothetical protein